MDSNYILRLPGLRRGPAFIGGIGKPAITLSLDTMAWEGAPYGLRVTFSRPVTGFVAGDITVTNGTIAGFAGAGDTYTALVFPTVTGLVTVQVAADVCDQGNRPSNELSIDAIAWLLRDEFITAEAAPLASPRTCEPGPGTLTIVDTAGTWSISGGIMIAGDAATGLRDPWIYNAAGLARVPGRALFMRLRQPSAYGVASTSPAVGFSTTLVTPDRPNIVGIALYSTDFAVMGLSASGNGVIIPPTYSMDQFYRAAVVAGNSIDCAFLDGVLVWVANATFNPMYPMALARGANQRNFDTDYFRVRDLPAPFTTDDGIAALVVESFTQSLGAELVTNGDFSAWTGDDPDNWVVVNQSAPDPEITERDPGQLHADAKTVGGAANWYASVSSGLALRQANVCAVGHWYEASLDVTAISVNRPYWSAPRAIASPTVTSLYRALARQTSTSALIAYTTSTGQNFTIDDVSCRRVFLNEQHVVPADALIDFSFTAPASPAVSDTVRLCYRISDASLEAGYNCWQAYLLRNINNNAWDFRLDSVSAGTATNRINVTGVGTPTRTRVICDGSKHNCYTLEGTTWTKHGSEVDVSHNDDATGVNTVYASGTTPASLRAYPRRSAAYAELDRL